MTNTIPPRPDVSDEFLNKAAEGYAHRLSDAVTEKELVAAYEEDGFDILIGLIRHEDKLLNRDDLDVLDEFVREVNDLVFRAQKKWAAEYYPVQPLIDGTRIKQGVIINTHGLYPAHYRVKENGCTIEGRALLIKFEDAELCHE